CLVNQREVFSDTQSFTQSLKHVLRQDPDIVLIGEMRDLETIEAALVVAETGHLVFSTLHTNSAVQTINRIIDVFPPHQQSQVRAQLSLVLQGAISQQLIARRDGRGRVLAAEVMIPNAAIRNLIREEKVHQIYSQMQVGQSKFGMQTMSQALIGLVQRNLITPDEAVANATKADAGLPIVQCLSILAAQTDSKPFRRAIGTVKDDVESGTTLAEAIRKHSKIFSDLYTHMVQAGEVGGILDTILVRLANYLE